MDIPKVLIVHSSYTYGGAERSLMDILSVVSPDRYYLALNPAAKSYAKANELGFKVYPVKIKYFNKSHILTGVFILFHIFYISGKLRKICRQKSVGAVYFNTHRSLPYAVLLRGRGIRIVCSCRDNLKTMVEKSLIKFMTTKVVAVSQTVKTQLDGFSQVYCLHNAVYKPVETGQAPGLRVRYDIPANAICIGMVSNILEWKNQADFIKIGLDLLKRGYDAYFIMIGTITDKTYYKNLVSLIDKSTHALRFIFTGNVEDMSSQYPELDYVVHTAVGEPFGRVIVEAMHFGKPVVTYDSGGPGEIVEDGVNGYTVPVHDITAAADRINYLIENPEKRQQLEEKARKDAVEKYEIRQYVKKFEEILLN